MLARIQYGLRMLKTDASDNDVELSHLALADRHIQEGIVRILKQETLIERMQSTGAELGTARRLLKALQSGLLGMQQHRALIVQAIATRHAR